MRNIYLLLILILIIIGCNNQDQVAQREEWISQPVSNWPNIALTNDIQFEDTTYRNLANAFIIDTGFDTLAVSCKHLFLVFQNNGLNSIDLGKDFKEWTIYPKGKRETYRVLGSLINSNKHETIGDFNSLKNRDWIIFNIISESGDIFPLKLRSNPIYKNEIVYAIGWTHNQSTEFPSLIKMKIFENMGNFFYATTLSENVNPAGRSGSPVIDSNGYLVGITSGAEGNLSVIGSIDYLKKTLNDYDIMYK